jgi:hypothetical protein
MVRPASSCGLRPDDRQGSASLFSKLHKGFKSRLGRPIRGGMSFFRTRSLRLRLPGAARLAAKGGGRLQLKLD